jgi:hypothetical protein
MEVEERRKQMWLNPEHTRWMIEGILLYPSSVGIQSSPYIEGNEFTMCESAIHMQKGVPEDMNSPEGNPSF